MDFLPSVVRAEYLGEYRVQLTFNDGLESTLDFWPWLHGPVFEPLKDRSFFQSFFLDGGTLAWPNGADVAPETLYGQARANEEPSSTSQPAAAAGVERRRRAE